MKILFNGNVYLPIRANFVKNNKPTNNKFTFTLPANFYYDFDTDDEFDVYINNKLFLTAYVINKSLNISGSNSFVTIDAYDKESLVFNRIWSESFVDKEAPIILGSIIGKVTNDLKGIHLTRINIKFVGYPRTDGIQVTVTEHPEIEFTLEDYENNTAAYQEYENLPDTEKFKKIKFAPYMKPVYDIVKELSQPKNTGTDRSFYWFIDENNTFRWFATLDSAKEQILTTDYVIKKTQESKVNFIRAYCGKDLNGAPIYIYSYKDYSGTPNLSEGVKDWGDIAEDLRPYYTNNTEFREAVREKALARARAYFESETLGRINGNFTLFEPIYIPGETILISPKHINERYLVQITGYSLNYTQKQGLRISYDFEEVLDR